MQSTLPMSRFASYFLHVCLSPSLYDILLFVQQSSPAQRTAMALSRLRLSIRQKNWERSCKKSVVVCLLGSRSYKTAPFVLAPAQVLLDASVIQRHCLLLFKECNSLAFSLTALGPDPLRAGAESLNCCSGDKSATKLAHRFDLPDDAQAKPLHQVKIMSLLKYVGYTLFERTHHAFELAAVCIGNASCWRT